MSQIEKTHTKLAKITPAIKPLSDEARRRPILKRKLLSSFDTKSEGTSIFLLYITIQ